MMNELSTFTIDLSKFNPEQLEGMLRLFWLTDNEQVDRTNYGRIMRAYRLVTSQDDLNKLMDDIDPARYASD